MSARLRVRSRLSKQLWLTRVCGLVVPLLGPVRRAVSTLLCGRHARALLFSEWAGTCSSTSVFLPFSVFVFVHTGWLFFSIGDSTASRDGQRTRGCVSCGHDVPGADHWLHRDGHVSDRHFSSAIHFNINILGHMKVMRNIVFVGNTVLTSLLVPNASIAQLMRVCMRIQQGLRFHTPLVLVLARCRRQTLQFCVLARVLVARSISLSAPNAADARKC